MMGNQAPGDPKRAFHAWSRLFMPAPTRCRASIKVYSPKRAKASGDSREGSILSTWPGCAAICEDLTPPREQHARLTAKETASELIGEVPAMSRNRTSPAPNGDGGSRSRQKISNLRVLSINTRSGGSGMYQPEVAAIKNLRPRVSEILHPGLFGSRSSGTQANSAYAGQPLTPSRSTRCGRRKGRPCESGLASGRRIAGTKRKRS